MDQINNLFPITIIAATVLFVTREIIVSVKRYKAENRERKAVKSLLLSLYFNRIYSGF